MSTRDKKGLIIHAESKRCTYVGACGYEGLWGLGSRNVLETVVDREFFLEVAAAKRSPLFSNRKMIPCEACLKRKSISFELLAKLAQSNS